MLALNASAQSLAVFDTKLHAEKITLCDLINKQLDRRRNFNVTHYDSSFYFVSYQDHSAEIIGNWTFTIRHDSLNQYSFSSVQLPITAEWHNKLYTFADSAISVFTARYGKPLRDTIIIKNRFANNSKHSPGGIRKAMWIMDGQKLKVEFEIDGEHGHNHYKLSISRFGDYYGNMELPAWWDGY